jgi:hypothetical protein
LSNVLYRFDAEAIETIMVDAETAEIFDEELTKGRREHDVEIMIENVAGGMSDIAAEMGADLDNADLDLGYDIAERYRNLWSELKRPERIRANETYRITERVDRVNRLGFDVHEVDLIPAADDTSELVIKIKPGGRNFHANRLHSLTGIEALDNQARAILSDVHYYAANLGSGSATGKEAAAVRWRVGVFEPLLTRLRSLPGISDPIQAYCDLLNHRYVLASGLGRDVSNEEAMTDWIDHGQPGYPLD